MGQFFDAIPAWLVPWIQQQKIFFVASAPLSADGHVNVSPKGFEGTFHIVDDKNVWYEDLSGSGIETTAHLKENGRITIMFVAFEGPPRIVRLFGTGTVYEFDSPEYNALVPIDKRQPGSRSVIKLNVHKVGTSCGYSIPFYTFKSDRMKLHAMAVDKESQDIEAVKTASCSTPDSAEDSTSSTIPYPEKGLKWSWKERNTKSIDGLTGLERAHLSPSVFKPFETQHWKKDDESISALGGSVATKNKSQPGKTVVRWLDVKVVTAFVLGIIVSGVWKDVASAVGNGIGDKVALPL